MTATDPLADDRLPQDPLSFDDFLAEHRRELLRFTRVLVADPYLAEDVLQDVLLHLQPRWATVAAADVPLAYVRRSIVNQYLTWRRKWGRLVPTAQPIEPRRTYDPIDAIADRSALADEVAALPPRQRAAVVLRYFCDLPDGETAQVLGVSEATVRTHVKRALAQLRVAHMTPSSVTEAS